MRCAAFMIIFMTCSIHKSVMPNWSCALQIISRARLDSTGFGFGAEVRRRIVLGTYVLSSGFFVAYYKKAQLVRRLIAQEFNKVFEEVDFLITPTSPTFPFKIGEKINDPLSMYLSDIFTVGANIAGIPAINLPCGQAGNLPINMQIIGPYLSDFSLLNISKTIENIIS